MSEQRVISYKIEVDDAPVKSLKQQFREATEEAQRLATAEVVDEKALQAAIQKTAELKDAMMDVNEQVTELAAGSPFEKMKNSIGGVQGALMNLDFDKAATSAKALTNTITNLNPAAMASQFAAFGGVVMQLGKAVGMLTIKFVQMGVALLANPIFLLVAAIVAIVAAVVIFLDKIGVLQKIIEALMMPINMLIDAFYALTDAMGFTNKAGEETRKQVEESIKAYEEQAKTLKETNKNEQFIADDKLRRLKALDDGTKEYADKIKKYEREVLQLKLDNFKEEVRLAENQIMLMVAKGATSKAEFEKQKALLLELKKEMRTASTDLFVFDNTKPQATTPKDKQGASPRIKEKQKEADIEKQIEAETDAFIKRLEREREDTRIKSIKDEIERNRQASLIQLERRAEDTDFTKMSVDAKLQWDMWYIDEKARIEKEAADARAKQIDDNLKADLAALDKQKAAEVVATAESIRLAKEKADFEKALREQQVQGTLDTTSAIFASIQANAKEGSALAKSMAVAQATIDTYKAATAAYSAMAGIPVVGPVLGVAAAAAAVGMGIANVRGILNTPIPGGGGSSGGGTPPISASMGQPQQTPQINMFENNQNNQPMSGVNRVAVVDYTDIQNTGNRVAMLQNAVSLG
jgi:hypothetical protein